MRLLHRSSLPLVCLCLLVAACGGGGGSGGEAPPPPAPPVSLATPGVVAVKARANGIGWVLLTEKLRPLGARTTPERQLRIATDGAQAGAPISAPEGWSMIDFAVHPSGQISLVLAGDRTLRLQRRQAGGALIAEADFTDPLAATDPYLGDPLTIYDSSSLLPRGTRDAVRVAAWGEDLVLAFRSGRNAVVAHRLQPGLAGQFLRVWRRLVEPGVFMGGRHITSGTHDPFRSLDNHWHLQLQVDEAQQQIAIAVNLDETELAAGHAAYFDEPDVARVTWGMLATRLDGTGRRLGTTAVDTVKRSELHALRFAGDTLLIGGRVWTERRDDGTGWDGFVARLPRTGAPSLQVLDFDRGDVVLDLAPLPDDRIQVAGASGYWQNPTGGSISEEAQALLAVLPAPGAAAVRIPLPAAPRHNQLRTLSPWQGRWLAGGQENGPGTHSADGQPALLVADGYLRERAAP